MTNSKKLNTFDNETIAYHQDMADPTNENCADVVWLGGFKSDMNGTKALALNQWAKSVGRGFIRFDYFGHGESSGSFLNGSITRWRNDTLAVLDELAKGPQILVGSSMGGWLAILAALKRPERVKGLVLVAPAPDFTEDLIWEKLPQDIKRELEKGITYNQPSEYDDEPYQITSLLIEDGRSHLVLRDQISLRCPVRILHGMMDADVPWSRSLDLTARLASEDVTATFVKSGDHRLSDAESISRLTGLTHELCQLVDGQA